MFSDTISLTVGGAAKVLVRINQDRYSSEYRLKEATGEFQLNIRNSNYTPSRKGVALGQVDRHNVEFIHSVYSTPTTNAVVRKAYFVLENQLGDTLTDPLAVGLAAASFLTSANLTKLLNFES